MRYKNRVIQRTTYSTEGPEFIFDNEPGYCIFGVCKKFIRKLTDYFFAIIY